MARGQVGVQGVLYELLICHAQQGSCIVVVHLNYTASFSLVLILQKTRSGQVPSVSRQTSWEAAVAGGTIIDIKLAALRHSPLLDKNKVSHLGQCSTDLVI